MLVSNNVFKNRYVWDGSQTNFPISFPFLDNNHIQVWYAQPGQPDTDAVILGKENYTITGAGNPAGGVLTRTTAWAVGATIAIVRNVPITQLHQYTQYDNFPAESHEDALAKLTMIDQQQQELLNRSVKLPATDPRSPEEYAQDLLGARDEAKYWAEYAEKQADRTVQVPSETKVLASDSVTPRTLADRFADIINVKDFGAKGDGVSDDTASFRAAVAAAQGRTIFVPSGSYVLTGHIDGGDFWSDKPIEYNDGLVTIDNLNSLAANKFQSSLDIKKIVDYSISSSEYKALQGICRHANIIYFSLIIDDTKQRIVSFNIYTQSVVKSADFTNLGHANSIAYRNGYLYISVMGNSIVKINAETLVQDSIFTLPYNAWRIGYDPISDRFAVAGNEFYIYDYNFSEISKRKIPVPSSEDAKQTTQGLAYYAGVLYVPYSAISSRKGIVQTNSVVAYNQSGSILNYWYIGGGYGELEDIEVDSKKITFGFNTDCETNVTFYEADYTRAAWEPNSLASIQADQYNIYTISTKEHTIYCDSEVTALGDGTQERPFKRIKDAIQAIRNAKTKYSMLILQLTGNFSSEGPVFINALDQFLYIREGTLHSLYMYSCSAIRVAGVSFVGYPGNNYNNVYAEHSVVDFRNCNFYGDVEKSSAIVANRSDIYLTLPNYFYNHLYAGKIYSSDLTVGTNQSFSACQKTLTLYNETIARIIPNSVDSHLRNDGTSIILTYGTK